MSSVGDIPPTPRRKIASPRKKTIRIEERCPALTYIPPPLTPMEFAVGFVATTFGTTVDDPGPIWTHTPPDGVTNAWVPVPKIEAHEALPTGKDFPAFEKDDSLDPIRQFLETTSAAEQDVTSSKDVVLISPSEAAAAPPAPKMAPPASPLSRQEIPAPENHQFITNGLTILNADGSLNTDPEIELSELSACLRIACRRAWSGEQPERWSKIRNTMEAALLFVRTWPQQKALVPAHSIIAVGDRWAGEAQEFLDRFWTFILDPDNSRMMKLRENLGEFSRYMESLESFTASDDYFPKLCKLAEELRSLEDDRDIVKAKLNRHKLATRGEYYDARRRLNSLTKHIVLSEDRYRTLFLEWQRFQIGYCIQLANIQDEVPKDLAKEVDDYHARVARMSFHNGETCECDILGKDSVNIFDKDWKELWINEGGEL